LCGSPDKVMKCMTMLGDVGNVLAIGTYNISRQTIVIETSRCYSYNTKGIYRTITVSSA